MERTTFPKCKQIKVLSNALIPTLDRASILKLNENYNYLAVKPSKPLDHQSLQPVSEHPHYVHFTSFNSPILNAAIIENNVQTFSRASQKSSSDEKKNLSKHHLILPNNKQICVETLLSQCVNDEQSDRKSDAKLRARLKKKKLVLLKPRNFLLKNGRLRPIITANIKSGIFRSVDSIKNTKKRKDLCLIPSNVLYSQSTLPSRIQSKIDFSNDEWVVERTTTYMPNDWTRAITLNSNSSRPEGIFDCSVNETKNWECYNGLKGLHYGQKNGNFAQNSEKSTIHRLVTPDGFHLSTAPSTTNQFFQQNFGSSNGFKHPLQQLLYNDKEKIHHHNKVEPMEDTPICRTRFSRATRSPLQHDSEQLDKITVVTSQQQNADEVNEFETDTDKVVTSKNANRDRNRCKTCKKLYLGRRKVISHLKAFPDHNMTIPSKPTKTAEPKSRTRTTTPSTSPSAERLFDFLIQKIKNAPIDEKSHILFREISDFVEKLEAIRSQLLCDDNTHSSVEYLDKHCSKIFGTQEGNYHISLDILDQLASGIDPNDFVCNATTDANILPNQLDHNINVSLSSISESKIHLVEGFSEESLLKTVGDLMRKEGRMGDGNFDHIEISDNAVEAVTLKDAGTTQPILNLSLDLFKFDGT